MKSRKKLNPRLKSLDRNHNTRVRWELLDADYLNKLSIEELNYYAQFIDEYVGAAISKNRNGTPRKGHLHKTAELAKSCYDANNRRNNDLFSVSKALNRMTSLDITASENSQDDSTFIEKHTLTDTNLTEKAIIAQIDSGEQNEVLSFKEYIKVRALMTEDRKRELDPLYVDEHPKAYMYYYLYDNTRITDGKLDKLIQNPDLLEQFIENFELFKRKNNRSNRS